MLPLSSSLITRMALHSLLMMLITKKLSSSLKSSEILCWLMLFPIKLILLSNRRDSYFNLCSTRTSLLETSSKLMNLVLTTEAEVATDLRDLKEEAPQLDNTNNALVEGVVDLTLHNPPLPQQHLLEGGKLLLPPFNPPLSPVLITPTITNSDLSSIE